MSEKTLNVFNLIKKLPMCKLAHFTYCMDKKMLSEMATYLNCFDDYHSVAEAIITYNKKEMALVA